MPVEIPTRLPPVHVLCLRHGESHANAGNATSSPALIRLTAKGECQAQAIVRLLAEQPSAIICSPYLRARQTAIPTLKRFPSTACETWPIQEFTYLAPARCRDTSPAQRRPWVENYWLRADPQFVDGPGAESFVCFIARVQNALDRLKQFHSHRESTLVMFGHGQFFQSMRWLIENRPQSINAEAMRDFRHLDLNTPIRNAEGFIATHDGLAWTVTEGLSTP